MVSVVDQIARKIRERNEFIEIKIRSYMAKNGLSSDDMKRNSFHIISKPEGVEYWYYRDDIILSLKIDDSGPFWRMKSKPIKSYNKEYLKTP